MSEGGPEDRKGKGAGTGGPQPPRETPETPEPPPTATEPAYRCDLCGAPMMERHCKLVCTGCGYQRDCSDP